jgi:CBS domain containing-hemolysin-like protein
MTQVALVMKDKKLIGMVTTEDVLEELVGKINETAKLEAAEGKQ